MCGNNVTCEQSKSFVKHILYCAGKNASKIKANKCLGPLGAISVV